MTRRLWLLLPLLAAAGVVAAKDPALPAASPRAVTWTKTVLDAKFRSEGVAVADVNGDGKLDVLTGEHWYEAPNWTPHEMQPPKDHGTGEGGYSRIFAAWAGDFNGDGKPDLLTIGFPGEPCYWMENPGTKGGHWRKHEVWHSACNESPAYVDLLGTGQKVLLMATQPKGAKPDGNQGQMAYFTPAKGDPYALWTLHPISAPAEPGKGAPGTQRYSHGLGAGDLNGDGKLDVITTGGWWEHPASGDGTAPWAFHPASLGPDAADLFAHDCDGDGKADVLSTSAHKFGIAWFKQRAGKEGDKGDPTFTKNDLFPTLTSETHAAWFVDIDGDGQKDLVTGKRWWSHGRSEPGSSWPARIYWIKMVKEKDGLTSFTPHLIDDDSGVGTQFQVIDLNGDGLPDIVASNKKGVHVILQGRK